MLKTNYHTHCVRCKHATGNVIDYIDKAYSLGYIEIGMTDHNPILKSFMNNEEYIHNYCQETMDISEIEDYLNEIKIAKEKYKNKMNVLSGFECEYLPSEHKFYEDLRKKVDYLNFGPHFFMHEGKILSSYDQVDYKTIYSYRDNCIKAMETGLFNTIVHPDIFMYHYKNINGERKFDDAAIKVTKDIIECAIKNNIYLEINCNKIDLNHLDDPYKWSYPYISFFEIAKNYKDAKFLIGVDAHAPERLSGAHIERAIKFAKDLGINVEEKMIINH